MSTSSEEIRKDIKVGEKKGTDGKVQDVMQTVSARRFGQMAQQIQNTARAINDGSRERSVIFLVVALAVLREGSETVLFLYSLATGSEDGMRTTITGGLGGLAAGVMVGGFFWYSRHNH